MSLFSDIASTIGHTVDSLAAAVGADVSTLETLVNDLDGNGVDVFSMASKLGLSVEGFISGIVDLMRGDPHQLLLERLTGPVKPMNNAVSQLAHQWAQLAYLHQGTAEAIDAHISELFQGNGSDSYSGPAADALLSKHQDYQKYFTTLVEHAQTQHIRHATLGNHTSDYLSQVPGKVSGLSTPMAAFSLLTLDTAAATPPSSVLDDQAVQDIDQAMGWVEQTGQNLEGEDPDPTGDSQAGIGVLVIIVLIILAVVWVLVVVVSWLHDALTSHQSQQKNTPPTPQPTPKVGSGSGPQNTLTPAQQNLHNDVASRLAGTTYDSREIDDLIRAGYLDPDAIAAIIRGGRGTFAVFNDPNNAALMNELTGTQQLKFITLVEQYQMTHPGLTSHQVYNYLRYVKMKAQLDLLSNDITGRSGDPVSQAIGSAFSSEVSDLNTRLYQKVGNSINGITDPFTLTDDKLDGWYSNLTGIWGEWSQVKHYYQQGNLVALSTPLSPTGEVDLKINENGVEKWIEVKNTLTTNQWGKALTQARIYAQNGAKDIILEFPQQGVNGTPDLSRQQLNLLNQLRTRYPGVNFEVRTGATDPGIQIPFDPPSNNWGSYLP